MSIIDTPSEITFAAFNKIFIAYMKPKVIKVFYASDITNFAFV